jgi:hypothetical protein
MGTARDSLCIFCLLASYANQTVSKSWPVHVSPLSNFFGSPLIYPSSSLPHTALEEIQQFVAEASAQSHTPDMLQFLERYPDLIDRCRRVAAKPVEEAVATSAADMEGEARVYADLTQRHHALQKLLALKDEMIWTLLDDR